MNEMSDYEKKIQQAKVILMIIALAVFSLWAWNVFELLKLIASK